MLELSDFQQRVLERLRAQGFQFVADPLYASKVGVRKGNCGALLDPVAGGGWTVYGAACYLVEGNLSVGVRRGEQRVFVWKKSEVPATPERVEELGRFAEELESLLAARA